MAATPDSRDAGVEGPVATHAERPLAVLPHAASQAPQQQLRVQQLCEQIGNKLGSVSVQDCHRHGFVDSGGFSVNGRPLVVKEQLPQAQNDRADFKVLLMGGIHGDEYSSISIIFKWLDLFAAQGLEGEFHWLFAPAVNPDGLLDGNRAKRQNANGVDLNRNFPSQDWNASAVAYWQRSTGSNPRRYPGKEAASEPEVQWLVAQIERFQPDVIVSVHAPYHLLDFDGPAAAPDRIGELYLHQLGVYPGSLGNYAGLNKRIPVVTLELPSAGIMPPADQIALMWHDLVRWLDQEGRKALREPGSGAPVVSSALGAERD
ncbi:MAG TPA: M14 family zinc carboxypeptidase [Hyphomicrobiales bacterium]|nr:M14 family zinc carboxypeptidase [Hyphomicrobiales bacterium]